MAKNTCWLVAFCIVISNVLVFGCSEKISVTALDVAYVESDILERIIVFASTEIVDDYSKSSYSTRERLMPTLQDALATVVWPDYIIGWSMNASRGRGELFQFGKTSALVVFAEICTINGILSRYSGYCPGSFNLYIDEKMLQDKLNGAAINCDNCSYNFFSSTRDSIIKVMSNIRVECQQCRSHFPHIRHRHYTNADVL